MILFVFVLILFLMLSSSLLIYWLSSSVVEFDRPSSVEKLGLLNSFQQQQQSSSSSSIDVSTIGSRTAFVTIAVGQEAREFAFNMLRSLLTNAARDCASIVVITDDVRYFNDVDNVNSSPRSAGVVRLFDVAALPFRLPSVQRPKRQDGRRRMSERRANKLAIKWLKTQLFK